MLNCKKHNKITMNKLTSHNFFLDININLKNDTGNTSVLLMLTRTSTQCPLLLDNLTFESCIKGKGKL